MPSGRNQPGFLGFCVYFKRTGETDFADFGVIESLTPNFETTSAQQFDGRSGRRVLVHEQVSEFSFRYDVTTSSLSQKNLALALGSAAPSSLTQTVGADTMTITAGGVNDDGIVQLTDGTSSVFATRVAAVYDTTASPTTTNNDVTAVNASTGQITLATVTPTPGDIISILEGPNAGTYTVSAFGGGIATVSESLAVTEAAVTWDLLSGLSGADILLPGTDYNYNQDDGFGMLELLGTANAGTAVAAGLTIKTYRKALSGNRRIRPLSNNTSTRGTMIIIATTEEGGVAWRAEHEVSVLPQSPNFSIEEASTLAFQVSVTYNASSANPGGTFDRIKGALELGA